MKFRPCIDLHNGQVKQIVGGTLNLEKSETLATNFETNKPSSEFSRQYLQDKLTGGHVIMLGPGNTEAASEALEAYPDGLQVGGGITKDNAQEWLNKGASHVIVTSFVFTQGKIHWERLDSLVKAIGKKRLVLDLSCRKRDGVFYVVTNQWQIFTEFAVTKESLQQLAAYCDEFLVHGVDVEGKQAGILDDLVVLLKDSPIPVTYAGGVRCLEDLDRVERLGEGRVDVTVGSALDIFGGELPYRDVVSWHNTRNMLKAN